MTASRGPGKPAGQAEMFAPIGPRRSRPRAGRVLAIGGGKGGIGKSLLASNLGVVLARRGHRVVLVDADLGGANLHTCLGIDPPRRTLSDFIDRRADKIEEVMVEAGVPGLRLVSGALDALDAANLKYAQKLKLSRNLRALEVDFVILDLGAGTGFNALDLFLAADHGVLVLVPEPTSIENGYRFIKAAYIRKLASVQAAYGIEALVQEAVSRRQEHWVSTPRDLIGAVKRRDPVSGEGLERELRGFRPRLVVNQVRTRADRKVGDAVVAAWRKYVGLEMDYLGAIDYDDDFWKAVRRRRPVSLERPDAETTRAIVRIAERIESLDQSPEAL